MATQNILTDEEVIAVKRNAERLNINQWAKRLGVSYRTVQKVVYRETYRDVGELHECWFDLREKQRPGRKAGGENSRRAQPSHLEAHADLIVDAYGRFLLGLSDLMNKKHGVETTPERVKAFLANHGRAGLRMGRTAKLNTREVMSVRTDLASGMSYAAISEKYGISRPLISKVCGRGKYDARSYVPSDYEEDVGDEGLQPDIDPYDHVTLEVTDDGEG